MWRLIQQQNFRLQSYINRLGPIINNNLTITDIAKKLNVITGYHQVEQRKNSVLEKDNLLQRRKQDFLQSKQYYEDLIDERRKCQHDLDNLRDRKNSLSDADITRITELYRLSLSLDKQEKQAKEQYKKSTEEYEQAQNSYLSEMRERYVEEQMYSDKIRQASTYWTVGLITTHLVLFLLIQFVVEPRKKEKLFKDVVEIVHQSSIDDHAMIKELLKPAEIKESPIQKENTLMESIKELFAEMWSSHSYWKGVFSGFLFFILFKPILKG